MPANCSGTAGGSKILPKQLWIQTCLLYTSRNHPARDTALQQRTGIGRLAALSQLAHDLFIAGRLDIAAEQDIRQPADGVEPVRRQE